MHPLAHLGPGTYGPWLDDDALEMLRRMLADAMRGAEWPAYESLDEDFIRPAGRRAVAFLVAYRDQKQVAQAAGRPAVALRSLGVALSRMREEAGAELLAGCDAVDLLFGFDFESIPLTPPQELAAALDPRLWGLMGLELTVGDVSRRSHPVMMLRSGRSFPEALAWLFKVQRIVDPRKHLERSELKMFATVQYHLELRDDGRATRMCRGVELRTQRAPSRVPGELPATLSSIASHEGPIAVVASATGRAEAQGPSLAEDAADASAALILEWLLGAADGSHAPGHGDIEGAGNSVKDGERRLTLLRQIAARVWAKTGTISYLADKSAREGLADGRRLLALAITTLTRSSQVDSNEESRALYEQLVAHFRQLDAASAKSKSTKGSPIAKRATADLAMQHAVVASAWVDVACRSRSEADVARALSALEEASEPYLGAAGRRVGAKPARPVAKRREPDPSGEAVAAAAWLVLGHARALVAGLWNTPPRRAVDAVAWLLGTQCMAMRAPSGGELEPQAPRAGDRNWPADLFGAFLRDETQETALPTALSLLALVRYRASLGDEEQVTSIESEMQMSIAAAYGHLEHLRREGRWNGHRSVDDAPYPSWALAKGPCSKNICALASGVYAVALQEFEDRAATDQDAALLVAELLRLAPLEQLRTIPMGHAPREYRGEPHVVSQALGATIPAPDRDAGLVHFRCLAQRVELSEITREIEANDALWTLHGGRQTTIKVQEHTQSIPLRGASRMRHRITEDNHTVVEFPIASHYPVIMNWCQRVAASVHGELARVTLVRLSGGEDVHAHIDFGEYYAYRNRYHLVVTSASGSLLFAGEEHVRMQPGEFWWFNNKAVHWARNESSQWRVHIIFDVRPLALELPWDALTGGPTSLTAAMS